MRKYSIIDGFLSRGADTYKALESACFSRKSYIIQKLMKHSTLSEIIHAAEETNFDYPIIILIDHQTYTPDQMLESTTNPRFRNLILQYKNSMTHEPAPENTVNPQAPGNL